MWSHLVGRWLQADGYVFPESQAPEQLALYLYDKSWKKLFPQECCGKAYNEVFWPRGVLVYKQQRDAPRVSLPTQDGLEKMACPTNRCRNTSNELKKIYKPKKPSAQPLRNCRCLLTRLTHAGFCAERENNIVSVFLGGGHAEQLDHEVCVRILSQPN